MNSFKSYLLSGMCAAMVLWSAPALAGQTYGPLTLDGAIKAQMTLLENNDLGTANARYQNSQIVEGRLRATLKITDDVTAMTEARAVKNFGDGGGIDQDTGELLGRDDFAELRQYWVSFSSLFGYVPLSAKLGRQRFSEPVGLWWNRDFDAVRLSYNTTLLNSFIAAGQNMGGYRTTKDDFRNDDEDLLRVMGETSWQWRYGHFIEGRFSYLNDHSGRNAAGSLFDANNRDSSDARLAWAGIRSHGLLRGYAALDGIAYRLDLMGVAGTEDTESTAAAPGGMRSVTGYSERDVRGWAFDSSLRVPLPTALKADFIAGYAFGSGDDNPNSGTDNAFRQTGLDSNSSRLGFSNAAVHNFGSVLRPDLSNIHILTAGLSAPLFTASDITGIYHYYHLDEKATGLLTSGIRAPLNNRDRELGHGLDLVLSSNLTDEFGLDTGAVGPLTFKATAGAFRAGDAYGAADDEWSSRGYIEFQLRF